jgi:maltose alpha-D-glucosyltransferase/alpha-amylase
MNKVNNQIQTIKQLWKEIYGTSSNNKLEEFVSEIEKAKQEINVAPNEAEWYKDVTVYSIYVDLFNNNFQGLEEKLDYLQELGVSCLWLLPILDSPGRDAGFDIKDYRKVRPDLLDFKPQDEVFDAFLTKAHQKGIKVLFDIAINHTSEEHHWFVESKKSKENPYRDYYIWDKDDKKYEDARIIFYGIEESNWKKEGHEYFFHRFFDFQPDLNYHNPQVLVEMTQNFLFWLKKGVDGFRADAIPYLWKEEGTDCENLPQTHNIVKFFRAVIDYVRPNTLLLAEACQKPKEVVKYFGDGDECHAGYHFPLMPQIYKAIAQQSAEPITTTLSRQITPEIPEASQWFTFLRCHDELSLELVYVTEEDRKYIHENYCKQPEWDFRLGQGISSRLAELMDNDADKIALIYSVMLTLPGTPVVYYGDEFAKQNDKAFYDEQIKLTGKDDTRFLVRGRIDWEELETQLQNPETLSAKVYSKLSTMLKTRSQHKAFGRGDINWLTDESNTSILKYTRNYGKENILVIQNLSDKKQIISINQEVEKIELSNNAILKQEEGVVELGGFGYLWGIIR